MKKGESSKRKGRKRKEGGEGKRCYTIILSKTVSIILSMNKTILYASINTIT